MSGQGVPRRIYKYRDFNNRTLSMLIDDIVYFADPTMFNDPLDAKPALAADIDNAAIETILARLRVLGGRQSVGWGNIFKPVE